MKNKINLKKINQFKIILFFDALTAGSRMLIGATSSLYLMSLGISPKDIILLKAFQALIMLFLEIPLGYLSDIINRKYIILFGSTCCFLWLFITGSAPRVIYLYVGEFFNAVSLTTFNGAIESEFIKQWKTYHSEKPLYEAFGIKTKYSFNAISVAALLGGIISIPGSRIIWFISASFIFLLMLTFSITYRGESRKSAAQKIQTNQNHYLNIKNIIKNSHKELIIPIVCMALLNAGFQIAIQYWQLQIPLKGYASTGTFFGILFFLIMFIQSRPENLAKILFSRMWLYPAGIILPSLLWIISVQFFSATLLIAISTIIFFWFYQATSLDLSSQINLNTSDVTRSTVLSTRSTLIRIIVITFAPIVNLFINNYGNVGALYLVFIITAIAVIFIILSGTYQKMLRYRMENNPNIKKSY